MPEVTGEVERIETKTAKNGGEYKAVMLKGRRKAYYDWKGHCEAANVKSGHAVRIEHDGSSFARITNLEKIDSTQVHRNVNEDSQQDRDAQIRKMCALKCSACVLQGRGLELDDLPEIVTALAEKLQKWVEN